MSQFQGKEEWEKGWRDTYPPITATTYNSSSSYYLIKHPNHSPWKLDNDCKTSVFCFFSSGSSCGHFGLSHLQQSSVATGSPHKTWFKAASSGKAANQITPTSAVYLLIIYINLWVSWSSCWNCKCILGFVTSIGDFCHMMANIMVCCAQSACRHSEIVDCAVVAYLMQSAKCPFFGC